VPTAVHDAQAALAGGQRFGNELRHLLVCLMPVHAMQVDMTLDAPATAPQVAQHGARDNPLRTKGIGAAEIEPVVDGQRSRAAARRSRLLRRVPAAEAADWALAHPG
jgi:hypothetical protein